MEGTGLFTMPGMLLGTESDNHHQILEGQSGAQGIDHVFSRGWNQK